LYNKQAIGIILLQRIRKSNGKKCLEERQRKIKPAGHYRPYPILKPEDANLQGNDSFAIVKIIAYLYRDNGRRLCSF